MHMTCSSRSMVVAFGLAIFLGVAAPARAALVVVPNFSFESPDLNVDGGFTVGVITSWTTNTAGGVFDPNSSQYTIIQATNGDQVAYSNAASTPQSMPSVIAANTHYTLQVDIGYRTDTRSRRYRIGPYTDGGTPLSAT